MKKTVKCVKCNTYFDITNVYSGVITIYLKCENCKFPLRVKFNNFKLEEMINLLSSEVYFQEVKNHYLGYENREYVKDIYPVNLKL